jgi:hypothetical protein
MPKFRYSLDSGTSWVVVDSALPYNIPGSDDLVVLVEPIGNTVTLANLPAAPSVTLTAGDGQVSIAWTDGSNGGAAITAHRIYVNGTGMSPITSASPFVLTGLANDVAVSIEVTAINSAGESARSTAQSVTPVAGGAPATSERIVSYGTSIPTLSGNASANLQKCTRKLIVIGADTPYLKGTFDNWRTEGGGDTPNTVSMTILQHAYLTLDGAMSAIATFDDGASTSKVLGVGSNEGIRIPHDQISAADLYGIPGYVIPRGTVLIMQTDTLLDGAGKQLYNCSVTTSNSSSIEFPATGTPITLGVGTIPAQSGQVSSNSGYTASCVYGYHSSNAHLNLGDSISADTGDNLGTAPKGGYSRAAQNMYGLNTVPMLNIARHGTVLADIINGDNSIATTGLMRSAYIAAGTFTDLRENFAANDISQNPSAGAAATVWERKQRFYALVRSRQPGVYITVVQPTPRTTNGSTNTVINSGWGRGGEADLLRQFQEQGLIDGDVDFVVRSNALRLSSDPTNDNYFLYKDMSYSLDGTHLNPAGYQIVIPEHRIAVLRGNSSGDEVAYTAGQKFLDTFSTGSGASVKSRTSDSGGTWTGLGAADMTVTTAGRAFFSTNGYLFANDSEMSRHQYLERDVDVVTAASPQQQVLLRAVGTGASSAFTGYTVAFNASTLLASISRVSNGVSTILASETITDPGASYTIRGEANGPHLKLSIGPKGAPVEVLSTVDGVWWTGLVGVRDTANATSTTGRHNDAVRAGNL